MGVWQQRRYNRIQEQHQTVLVELMSKLVDGQTRVQETIADQTSRSLETASNGSLLGVALGAALAAAPFLLSDRRLKKDVERLPGCLGGCPLYMWSWTSDATSKYGLKGRSCGVMAQEALALRPNVVRVG